MSVHIVAGFKRQARQGDPTILYIGSDLTKGLKLAGERASEFASVGRLSNPMWIPAKPAQIARAATVAQPPVDAEAAKKNLKGRN